MTNTQRSVLIVDDSPEDRLALRRYLQRESDVLYRCYEAATAAEGLARCRELQPDAVLLDYDLPDDDGLTLLAELVVEHGSHAFAMLMLTGMRDEKLAVTAMQLGAHDYLVKGQQIEHQLSRAIAGAIDRAGLQREILRQRSAVERSHAQLQQALDSASKQQALLNVTLASIGDGLITTDTYGRITFLNAEAERLTGWPNAEAAGQPLATVFRIVNAQTRAPAEDPAAKVLRTGSVTALANHTLLIGRDGRETPIDDSGAPIRHAGGAIEGVVLVFRDVTVREAAEAAVRESEENLRIVTETASVGLALVDADHRYRYTNETYKEFVNKPGEVLAGRRVADVLGPLYDRLLRRRLERAFGGEYVSEYLDVPMPSGGERHYEARLTLGVYQASPVVVVVLSDITERASAEAALRESEARYRQIVETAQEGIWQIDAASNTSFVNARMAELLGYTADEMLGAPLFAFMDAEGQAIAAANLERRREGIAEQHDFKFRHKDGSALWALINTNPVVDSAGTYVGALAMVTDITERKRADLALQRSAERLRVLADASRTFAEAGTDYEQLLGEVARIAGTQLGSGCIVRLISDDRQWLDVVAQYYQNLPGEKEVQSLVAQLRVRTDASNPIATVVNSGRAILIPRIDPAAIRASMSAEMWQVFQHFSPHSVVGTPLNAQGRAIGCLIFSRFEPDQPPFDEDDLRLAQDLADRAALAIGNARLLQQVQRELSERASAETALREGEERLRTVTETAQVGLVIVDPQHHYRYANRAYATMFHLPTAEIVGQRVADVLAPVYDAQIRPRLERAFGGERVSYELVVPPVSSGAEERHYAVTYEPGEYRSASVVVVVVVDITERKRAEQQLGYQAGLLAQVSDAIISTDLGFTIKSWNAAAEALYGRSAHEAIGRAMSDIVATEYVDGDREQVRSLFLREGRWRGEVMQQHHGGAQLSILSSVSLLKDSLGKPIGAVAVNRDITDRKQAEQALQRSAERLRVLADASRIFAEASADYQALLDRVARTTAEVLGDSCTIRLISDDGVWLRLASLYDADPEKLDIQRIILNGTPPRLDEQWIGAQIIQNQQPLLIPAVDPQHLRAITKPELSQLAEGLGIHSMLVVPIRVHGRAIGILGLYRHSPERPPFDEDDLSLAQDLADRAALAIGNARLLQQLQLSANRLQHLRAIDQAILAGSSLAEIAEAAVSHIEHLMPTTRIGVLLRDLGRRIMIVLALRVRGAKFPPPSTQAPLEVFDVAIEPLMRGEVYHVADVAALPELPAFIRAGQAEDVRSYFHMPIMAGGELIALLNVGSDQPDAFSAEHLDIAREVADQLSIAIQQARLREQAERHAHELEQRVVERTAALTAANKELEAFSYSVSHDLRAPLRAIDGFSRILQEDYSADLTAEAQRYLNLVRGGAQQMGHLIDDLLAFSRLSRQAVSRHAVEPGELVRQCLQDLREEQAGRRVEIAIGELPACQADPALLKQVWVNLVSNALKYTRRRDPAMIAIGSRVEGAETIYFVKDNGVGFDMRYSDKLFGVFQRMHRAEDYEGTGVGLAIVQRIIHRHGGRVWAEAAIDQGAGFYFTLGETNHD